MLSKVNKVAPYLALALLGYLTYSAMDVTPVKRAAAKDAPALTKQILDPTLLTPTTHASPADRDPFEVSWASYVLRQAERDTSDAIKSGAAPVAATAPAAASQPTTAPSEPSSMPTIPPLPAEKLVGVFLGNDFRIAVIGDRLYKTGSLVGGSDPARCWVLDSVDRDCVVLRFGETVATIPMSQEQKERPQGKNGRTAHD